MTSLDSPSTPVTYEFGPYRLAVADRTLSRAGVPLPLVPKAFDTLVVLVESRGRLVTKEELLRRVWPDTFVQESSLTQNVHVLRKILGEPGDDQPIIQTVSRQGYRFTPEVNVLAGDPESELVLTKRTTTRLVVEEIDTDDEAVVPVQPAVTRQARRVRIAAAVAAGTLLVAGGFALSRLTPDSHRPGAAPAVAAALAAGPRLERLTQNSNAYDPAISPDGRFVAYQVVDREHQTVWLKNVATGSTVQVLPPIQENYRGLTFSPDGNELFYKTFRKGSNNGTVMRVPVLGGTPLRVATDVWSDFGLSSDGKRIAFIRTNADDHGQLVVAGVDDQREQVVVTAEPDKIWFNTWDAAPSWSPDGLRLAMGGGWRDPVRGALSALFEVTVRDGHITRIPSPGFYTVSQVAWLHDGSGMIVVGQLQQKQPNQVWLLRYPSGEVRRLTNDLNDYRKLRLSADSQQLVIEQQINFNHLWIASTSDSKSPVQVTFGANADDGYAGVSWTPDGRILFVSSRTGEEEIWTARPDGSDARQLTVGSKAFNRSPRMSSDGRFIVFVSGRGGETNLWRMDADGLNVVQLTTGMGETSPSLSPDGRWVYYANYGLGLSRIERISIDGGSPQLIYDGHSAGAPNVSPDGKWLAIGLYSQATHWRNAVLPASGGKIRLFEWHSVRSLVRWTLDSKGIIFIKPDSNVSNLWVQPLDGGAPRQLTSFPQHFIWNFGLSPDGQQLVLARGSHVSDIVLMRDFR